MTGSLEEQAMAKIARYCSTRERAPAEVEKKLFKWGLNDHQVEVIIARLTHENYLSEARFARAYCHDKFEFNNWGKIRIRFSIKKYQLSEESIDEGLSGISEERYHDTAAQLVAKKWESLNKEENNYIRKQKTIAFLVRRGFEPDLIYPLVDKLG